MLAIAFVIAALLAFAFLPLGLVLRSAVTGEGVPLFREVRERGTLEALGNTVALGIVVTAAALASGALFAWLIERTDLVASDRARGRLIAVLSLPLAIPPYLSAMAWALLANGRNGLLNRMTSTAWIDVYGFGGVAWVLASAAYPFVLLAVKAALERADPSLEEAARVCGAGPFRVLSAVTLPLVMPALAGAAGLVFVFTTAAFGVPYLLGTVADPPVMFLTTRIYQFTALGGAGMLERAASVCLLLLFASVLVQAAAGALGRRRSTIQVGGKSARPSLVPLGRARPWLRAVVAAFALVAVLVPIFTIAWTSLERSFADPLVLTADHWAQILGRRETARAFSHSVVLAVGAAAIVVLAGLLVARISKALGRRGDWLLTLATTPYAVPGTVLAIGLILAFQREVRLILLERVSLVLHLPGTLGMLLAAYAVKYLAFGARGARAALDQIHPSLEEAARTSGASPSRSLADIVFPLIRPSLGAAFVLVALPCLSELTMSVLLFGAGTETLGTLLFELQSYSDPPAAAVVATMIAGFALAGDAVARRLARVGARMVAGDR